MSLGPQQVQFPELCKPLLEFVHKLITCDSSIQPAEFRARLSDVYGLCTASTGPHNVRLYEETRRFLEHHVQKLCTSVSSCRDDNLLHVYHQHWQKYRAGSSNLDQLYGYLNINYIKRQHIGKPYIIKKVGIEEQQLYIGELVLHTWERHMIEPLKENLVKLLLEKIHTDRCGGIVNGSIIHAVIHSLVDVEEYKYRPKDLYEKLFETPFLKSTGEHYRSDALKLLDLDRSQYMTKVISRLDDEGLRSRKFHPSSTHDKVIRECQQCMVVDHLEFLNGECKNMVMMERKEDLKHMYQLLSPVANGLNTLIEEVELHIKQTGQSAVEQLTDDSTIPTQFVEAMLEVHGKYTYLIKDVFHADTRFIGALDRACEAAINMKNGPKAVCKAPDWLTKYCDKLLKKSTKMMSETDIDNKLSRSITVFKYLNDKDLYEQLYSKLLAKRLLQGVSQSMDAEEAMISRLKQSCGHTFTHRMHRMFTDVRVSSDLNKKFNDSNKETGCDLSLNFSIHVLEAGAWPFSQNLPTFAIPQQLEKSISQFEVFYGEQHSNRRLTWMHTLCTAEVKLLYLQKPYFVTMSAFQMAVLLPYESQDTLTVKELQATTQLPEQELLKQIQSLVDSKILRAGTRYSTNENISFSLNMDYSNKRTKFKITAAVHKETKKDVEKTHQRVDEERKFYVQAIIVRIMKSRKHLKHNILIQEVFTQSHSRFVPSVALIKKCIDILIEKEYIERKMPNTDEYSYIA